VPYALNTSMSVGHEVRSDGGLERRQHSIPCETLSFRDTHTDKSITPGRPLPRGLYVLKLHTSR
jgi:hypothetical protein